MPQLEVRPSRIHGRGVFAAQTLPPRRKIGDLTGEIISVREARRRASRLEVIAIVEFDDGKALDASTDTCLRYVNHSCTPNTYMRRVGHRVEFLALRRIAAGQELTCDYGETHHDGALRCRCGSADCRERL